MATTGTAPGSDGMIMFGNSSGGHYRIICVQHEGANEGYLDAHGSSSSIYCSPHENDHTTWWLEDAGEGYVRLCNKKHDGAHMDAKGGSTTIYRSPYKNDHTSWKLVSQNDGTFRLKSKKYRGSDTCWLDGHKPGSSVYRSGYKNNYTKWRFVPLDFEFKCTLNNFVVEDLQQCLDAAKRPLIFTSSVNAKALGGMFSVTIGEDMENTFKWGLSQEVSIGFEVGYDCGVPVLGGAKSKVTGGIKVGASQEWTNTKKNNFQKQIQFTPDKIGKYKVYMVIWRSEDVKIPFTCDYLVEGKSKSGGLKVPSSVIDWYAKSHGLAKDVELTKRGNGFATYRVKGTMDATMALDVNEGVVPEEEWASQEKSMSMK